MATLEPPFLIHPNPENVPKLTHLGRVHGIMLNEGNYLLLMVDQFVGRVRRVARVGVIVGV